MGKNAAIGIASATESSTELHELPEGTYLVTEGSSRSRHLLRLRSRHSGRLRGAALGIQSRRTWGRANKGSGRFAGAAEGLQDVRKKRRAFLVVTCFGTCLCAGG